MSGYGASRLRGGRCDATVEPISRDEVAGGGVAGSVARGVNDVIPQPPLTLAVVPSGS